jgi:diguanylate cyclase (GGDEF)-like protein
MTDEERTYVVLRLGVLAIGLPLLFVPGIDPVMQEAGLLALAMVAVGVIVLAGATLYRGRTVAQMMLWVLPVDLLAVGVFTSMFAEWDGAYPVCVLLGVLYGLVQSRRDALGAAVLFSSAYIVGHVLAPPANLFVVALIAVKALTLVVVSAVVANSVRKQREREHEVESEAAERARVNRQLEHRVAELQAISEITEVLHSSLDSDEVGVIVLDVLAGLIGFSALAVFVIDKDRSETLFSASVGVPHESGRRNSGVLAPGEIEAHMTCRRVFHHGSMMVLFCASAEDMERINDNDELVIHAVASELVVAVENSHLYKLTKRLAVTDELTGMKNYRFLQQKLDEEVSRSKRYGKHLSFVMMDVDDFKQHNDCHGHLAGDRALSEFLAVVSSVVREVDVIARYGGEEFAIVLPETDPAGAFVVAEKIREALEAHLFADGEGARCCTLTVSLGVATYPTHASDKETLLHEADDALYRAKNGGKNRVCAAKHTAESQMASGE